MFYFFFFFYKCQNLLLVCLQTLSISSVWGPRVMSESLGGPGESHLLVQECLIETEI